MLHFLLSLTRNPKFIFLYHFFTKWYILMMLPAITAAFFVIQGLEKSGVLDKFQTLVQYHLDESVYIAKECTPKITDLKEFIKCIP